MPLLLTVDGTSRSARREHQDLSGAELRHQISQAVQERSTSHDQPGHDRLGRLLLGLLDEHAHRQEHSAG